MKYTVIGFYENGQRFVDHIEAESPDQALQLTFDKTEDALSGGLAIVDVINGFHNGLLEGNTVCDAEDFLEEEEE